MDFSLKTYKKLLSTLTSQGFSFLSFEEFLSSQAAKIVVLRHDVDLLPGNSLIFAGIEAEMGIRGSYYFRTVKESFNEKIIKEIYSLGHEIGYHYEDLSFAQAKIKAEVEAKRRSRFSGSSKQKAEGEDLEKLIVSIGIESFKKNLNRLREIVPVNTICMHGSPMSKWDSRLLWKYYDYHDFGIIGEPYFDIDFDEVLYLTDTGRRWDGELVSIRDKALGTEHRAQGENPYADWRVKPVHYREETGVEKDLGTKRLRDEETKKSRSVNSSQPPNSNRLPPFPKFHSTFDIIHAAEEGKLPDKIMMTFHSQRWTDKPVPWMKELVWQNVKNVGKFFLIIASCK